VATSRIPIPRFTTYPLASFLGGTLGDLFAGRGMGECNGTPRAASIGRAQRRMVTRLMRALNPAAARILLSAPEEPWINPELLYASVRATVFVDRRFPGRPVCRVRLPRLLGGSIRLILPHGREVYIVRGGMSNWPRPLTGNVLCERCVVSSILTLTLMRFFWLR